jgi:cytochrome c oxidase subunit II
MKRSKTMWRIAPLIAMLSLLLSGCGSPQLSALMPRGSVASEQLFLIKLSIGIMGLVIVVVAVLYFIAIIRFRKRKGQTGYPKQVEGSHKLEIIWTVIPIILLVILAVPTVYYTFLHSTDMRKDPNALQVKVTAHQYWWEFEYPELGIHTAQDLVVPQGKNIALELESADVTHSFWVPSLGGKLDANRGMATTYYLKADEVDTFLGKCTEFCGASHSLMDFKVISKETADFDAWVEGMKKPVVVTAEAEAGKVLFDSNCLSCHAVEVDKGTLGPNLNNFANRTEIAGILEHTDENLKEWIKDPYTQKIGSKMPAFKDQLKDEEIDEIVKYLNSLNNFK